MEKCESVPLFTDNKIYPQLSVHKLQCRVVNITCTLIRYSVSRPRVGVARGTRRPEPTGGGGGRAAQLSMAYLRVQSLAFLIASLSFTFHSSATSLASGSSGFGADSSA